MENLARKFTDLQPYPAHSDAPRPVSATLRVASDTLRAVSDTPRAVSDTPRAVSDTPRPTLVSEGEAARSESQAVASKLNWLRAGVLGANDGIVSVAAVVIGVAAADAANTGAIATAGAAALVAGALSMATGEYVSVSTQRDTEKALVEKERQALAADPDGEFEELVEVYVGTGLSRETARQVVAEYTALDPIKAHVSAEYGVDAEEFTNPWTAALSSGVSFTVGAILPLLTILLMPVGLAIPATFVAVVAALALAGFISARLGEAPLIPAMVRNMVGGALAMIITGGVGHLLGVSL